MGGLSDSGDMHPVPFCFGRQDNLDGIPIGIVFDRFRKIVKFLL